MKRGSRGPILEEGRRTVALSTDHGLNYFNNPIRLASSVYTLVRSAMKAGIFS